MTEKELKEKVEELAEAKQKTEESEGLSDIEKHLKKLKEANDDVERELLRQEELRAKVAIGGRALAGQQEQTQEDKDAEEATKILKTFRS